MDRRRGATSNAFAALDAFPVTDLSYVHFAVAHAGITVNAFRLIHLDPKEGDGIEERIYGAKGTQETAKGTETKDAGQQDQD
jgi:hypothetical protein